MRSLFANIIEPKKEVIVRFWSIQQGVERGGHVSIEVDGIYFST